MSGIIFLSNDAYKSPRVLMWRDDNTREAGFCGPHSAYGWVSLFAFRIVLAVSVLW